MQLEIPGLEEHLAQAAPRDHATVEPPLTALSPRMVERPIQRVADPPPFDCLVDSTSRMLPSRPSDGLAAP